MFYPLDVLDGVLQTGRGKRVTCYRYKPQTDKWRKQEKAISKKRQGLKYMQNPRAKPCVRKSDLGVIR